MIDQSKITDEWVGQIAREYKADPQLIETVIRAFLLVEGLARQELPFVFKGGTALMLLFDSDKRLSIDIDIILPDRSVDIEHVLDWIVQHQEFNRWEHQERPTTSAIRKEHYKLHYTPSYQTRKEEENVLLDILFEDVHYAQTVSLPVRSHFVPQSGDPVLVNTATIEDLLGDKLTAFAPNTTGIPYFKGDDSMSMEIIKQLYDISNLFDRAEKLDIIKTTFQKIADVELAYRGQADHTPGDVLNDIYLTALSIATRGKDGKAHFEELQLGIKSIQSYIYSESYYLEKAITDASKAAYLATVIKQDAKTIKKFGDPEQMKNKIIEGPMNTKLNKLKKGNLEAFFYWYKTYELNT